MTEKDKRWTRRISAEEIADKKPKREPYTYAFEIRVPNAYLFVLGAMYGAFMMLLLTIFLTLI